MSRRSVLHREALACISIARMQNINEAYAVWKRADTEARAVETRLFDAWQAFDKGSGQPPSAELMKEVSSARAVANDKLTVALGLMSLAQREAR